MRSYRVLAGTGVVAISLLVSDLAGGTAQASAPTTTTEATTAAPTIHSCAPAKAGYAACLALVRTDRTMTRAQAERPDIVPAGYGPSSIQSAYKLSGLSASGRTVAIVDAYNDPTAEADLGVYRSQFGLSACTTANGCFKKVSQTGSTTALPATNASWAEEISLDVDMVSAACPTCHILLVEAKTASTANLGTAVNQAAKTAGVVAISNSYGGSDARDTTYGKYYNHPGIAVTASTGDSGYQAGGSYPADSAYVTAVGGTSLRTSTNSRGWTETAWSGAGSGCSAFNTMVAPFATTSCNKRAMADVSAVADPNTGVAVYDSTKYQGLSGWLVFGGTSASSPIVASVFALSGHTTGYPAALYTAPHPSSLFDVTSGSNGSCSPPSPTKWCHAGAGWDGPTGLGTPNGTAAF
jgi:subtilase family serine protease